MVLLQGFFLKGNAAKILMDCLGDFRRLVQTNGFKQVGQFPFVAGTRVIPLMWSNFLNINGSGSSVEHPVGNGFSGAAVRLGQFQNTSAHLADSHSYIGADNPVCVPAKTVAVIRQFRHFIFSGQLGNQNGFPQIRETPGSPLFPQIFLGLLFHGSRQKQRIHIFRYLGR